MSRGIASAGRQRKVALAWIGMALALALSVTLMTTSVSVPVPTSASIQMSKIGTLPIIGSIALPTVNINSTSVEVGAAAADASCGYYWQYSAHRIYTTSNACKVYFDNNGWRVFQIGYINSTPVEWWLARDGT